MLRKLCLSALLATCALPSFGYPAAGLPALRCLHTSFADTQGNHVLLRGINLGGWFVEEMWMTPFQQQNDPAHILPQVLDHVSLWKAMESHIGTNGMLRARDRYRQNWITSADFARIKAAGFNSVRLPILYDLIDEPATSYCRSGLNWLKIAVSYAKSNGLYVVLDMHGAPGGQSSADHTGQVNQNQLWFGWQNIPKMEAVWRQLATEFKNEPTVAMYDIMNEPMGAYNQAAQYLVFDRAIRAIRAVDPLKIVMVEDGYHGLGESPNPDVPGWTNVSYSVHQYNFGATKPQDHIDAFNGSVNFWQQMIGYRDSPMYLGEFNIEPNGTPDTMKSLITTMEAHDWSWATWTYKTMSPGGPMGNWGLYRNAAAVDPIRPFSDNLATVIGKLDLIKTENMVTAPGLLEMFKSLPPLH